MLPCDLARSIRELGQSFNPKVAQATRALTRPCHDPEVIAALPVLRDIAYGPHARHRLDLYGAKPKQTESIGAGRPVVVFVHGGAFVAGDKTAADGAPFYENVAVWALANDMACIAMTYRLAPDHTWPAGSQDVAAAVAWIHREGAVYGIDPARILLIGQSAGAVHVAGYLADPALHPVAGGGLAGVALLSGLYDMVRAQDNPPKFAYFGTEAALYGERSAMPGILAHCRIPLLLGICEYDPADFQAQALLLAQALFERDGRLPHIAYQPGHNHLSSIYLIGGCADTLGPQLAEFAAAVVSPPSNRE